MKIEGRAVVPELSPRGLSKLLLDLDNRERNSILKGLDPETLTKTLRELPGAVRRDFFRKAPLKKLVELIGHAKDDVAIDFLQEIRAGRSLKILRQLPAKKRRVLEELLRYPHDTAGGLMTKEFMAFRKGTRISELLKELKGKRLPDSLYVVDESGRFFGEIKTKELLFADPKKTAGELANRDIMEISPETDREEVIKIFTETDETILPVVDSTQQLAGAITVDDVIDALQKEVSEDLSLISGSTGNVEDALYSSTWNSVKARIPWLMFTVFGEIIFTGNIIHMFDGVLARYISLSFFLPVLMCLSGDSSIQSSIVAIKGLSEDRIKNVRNFLFRDLKVGLVLGMLLGLLAAAVSLIWLHSLKIGIIVGVSVTASLVMANFIGTMLPVMFDRMGMDPAVSTGPLLTTTMDVISMGVYFITATLLLETFVAV